MKDTERDPDQAAVPSTYVSTWDKIIIADGRTQRAKEASMSGAHHNNTRGIVIADGHTEYGKKAPMPGPHYNNTRGIVIADGRTQRAKEASMSGSHHKSTKSIVIADGHTEYGEKAYMPNPHHESTDKACNSKTTTFVDGTTLPDPEYFAGMPNEILQEIFEEDRYVTGQLPVQGRHGSAQEFRFADLQSFKDNFTNLTRGIANQNREKGPYALDDKSLSSQLGTTVTNSHPNDTFDDIEDQAEYNAPGNRGKDLVFKEDIDIYGVSDDETSNRKDTKPEQGRTASKREDMPVHEMRSRGVSPQASGHQRDNSWTSSTTWESDAEKVRKRWAQIKRTMAASGFDKSPFAPQSFLEYIKIELTTIESELKAVKEQLKQYEDRTRREPEQHPGFFHIPKHETGRVKNFCERLQYLPRSNTWNYAVLPNESTWPRWDALEAGDRRALQGGSRGFPFPHGALKIYGIWIEWIARVRFLENRNFQRRVLFDV
ncbi:hypothetical protein F5Y09DRAFT_342325 [Xylaria sp. FL1042]|nr:hypothetical protein F5Y09DRAFT_342325 [Xylaria sp. FL1042]